MNSTQDFWSVDGVSLQTFAYNVVSKESGMAPPPMRGDNITVPFAPGQTWVRKVPDARTITLQMWVQGSNIDGTVPNDAQMKKKFEENARWIRKLVWKPRQQLTLTKQFWLPTAELTAAGVSTTSLTKVGNYALYTATAKAEFIGGFDPSMTGAARAVFEIDFYLADPYFYSPEISRGIAGTFTVLGDDRTHNVSIELVGTRTNPVVRNTTLGTEFRYNGAVATGETLTVDVKNFTAQITGSATRNGIGSVVHSGDSFWFPLEAGSNALTFSSTAGAGAVTLKYQPVWI